jgi:hypothetical protein
MYNKLDLIIILLNNALYKIPRMQILKKLITRIHACSYIEFWHAYSYNHLELV